MKPPKDFVPRAERVPDESGAFFCLLIGGIIGFIVGLAIGVML